MGVTADELVRYGKHAIDLYLRNTPIDAVNAERPLLKMLMAGKKETTSGKDKIYVQIRKGNDSNFQDFYGSEDVTYNRKDTIEQSYYEYVNFHDGFSLHEDDFIRNGVTITEGGPGKKASASEKETITNMFNEHLETLRLGFEEAWDVVMHCGYSTNVSALVGNIASNPVYGLSDAISITPTTGTYAGISRVTNTYWRNYAATGVTVTASTGTIESMMREAWRACTKYGGRPDKILCGSTFLDGYIDYMLRTYGRVNYTPVSGKDIEGAEGGVFYQGVPLVWDPTFDTLQDNSIEGATYSWKKRCYFINTKFLKLMPIKGQHMVSRTPPRIYNKYEYFWALTTRFYFVNTKPAAHAVLVIA